MGKLKGGEIEKLFSYRYAKPNALRIAMLNFYNRIVQKKNCRYKHITMNSIELFTIDNYMLL